MKQEKQIDSQYGDGEQITDKIIVRDFSVRWKTAFTPEKTANVTFELKADDGCRLFIDGEKKIETDLKNTYYTLNGEKGKSYDLVVDYWQSNNNAEVKLEIGKMEQTEPQNIASSVGEADVIIFAIF